MNFLLLVQISGIACIASISRMYEIKIKKTKCLGLSSYIYGSKLEQLIYLVGKVFVKWK